MQLKRHLPINGDTIKIKIRTEDRYHVIYTGLSAFYYVTSLIRRATVCRKSKCRLYVTVLARDTL